MGTWSSNAPTLPSGSQWSNYAESNTIKVRHYAMTLWVRHARLSGNGLVLEFWLEMGKGQVDFNPPSYIELIAWSAGEGYGTQYSAPSANTVIMYYTMNADPGEELWFYAWESGTTEEYWAIIESQYAPALLTSAVKIFTDSWHDGEVFVYDSEWKSGTVSVYDSGWKEAQ